MNCLHEHDEWVDCDKGVMYAPLDFVEVHVDPARTLSERFEQFHKANPHVYDALRKMALTLKQKGHKRIGIAMLFEQLRWQYYMRTNDVTGFKLNNNYRANYARALMQQESELADFFTTRETK